MKKLIALLLAAIMLMAVCLPALAEEPENPYAEDGVEILRDADGNVIDLGGMEIIINEHWSHDWHDDEPETASAEATKEYRLWLEKTYNFTIRTRADTTWADCPTDFNNFATTGGDENYVWAMRYETITAPMRSGLFYDLATLDCLDFTQDKWNANIKNLTTKGDSVFGMRAADAEPRKGVFFNKRLLTEAGVDPESLYDMQRDGTWTWEAFEELCKKLTRDTDNDGVTDRYAMMSFSAHIIPAALNSNGADFFAMDENGKFTVTANSDAFMEAANWVVDMISKYEMPAPEGAEWNYFDAAFLNGEVALQVYEDYHKSALADMEDDFGFVMFPKGPRMETYVHAPTDNVYVIPACYDADRAWKIAFAYNLFTQPTPGYEDDDAWKTAYYNAYRDERAVDETIAMMLEPEHQVIAVTSLVPGFDGGPEFYWDVYGGMAPGDKVDSMMGTWQAYVDAVNGD